MTESHASAEQKAKDLSSSFPELVSSLFQKAKKGQLTVFDQIDFCKVIGKFYDAFQKSDTHSDEDEEETFHDLLNKLHEGLKIADLRPSFAIKEFKQNDEMIAFLSSWYEGAKTPTLKRYAKDALLLMRNAIGRFPVENYGMRILNNGKTLMVLGSSAGGLSEHMENDIRRLKPTAVVRVKEYTPNYLKSTPDESSADTVLAEGVKEGGEGAEQEGKGPPAITEKETEGNLISEGQNEFDIQRLTRETVIKDGRVYTIEDVNDFSALQDFIVEMDPENIIYSGHGTPDGFIVFPDCVVPASSLFNITTPHGHRAAAPALCSFYCCFALAVAMRAEKEGTNATEEDILDAIEVSNEGYPVLLNFAFQEYDGENGGDVLLTSAKAQEIVDDRIGKDKSTCSFRSQGFDPTYLIFNGFMKEIPADLDLKCELNAAAWKSVLLATRARLAAWVQCNIFARVLVQSNSAICLVPPDAIQNGAKIAWRSTDEKRELEMKIIVTAASKEKSWRKFNENGKDPPAPTSSAPPDPVVAKYLVKKPSNEVFCMKDSPLDGARSLVFTSHEAKEGDAFTVECCGVTVVVDGGKAGCDFTKTQGLTPDFIVLTHGDADHYQGLLQLMGKKEICETDREKVEKMGCKYLYDGNIACERNTFTMDKLRGGLVQHSPSAVGRGAKNLSYPNIFAMSILFTYKERNDAADEFKPLHRIFISSDADAGNIKENLDACKESLKFSIATMPHHGSPNNSHEVFINEFQADHLFITGDFWSSNGVGRPHPDVLKYLGEQNRHRSEPFKKIWINPARETSLRAKNLYKKICDDPKIFNVGRTVIDCTIGKQDDRTVTLIPS